MRLCLLISLTISPLWADFWDWVTQSLFGSDQSVSIGPYTYALPGVRIALWGGGIITFVAGFFAWRSIRKAEREAAETGEPTVAEEGPLEFRPLGLVEPSPIATEAATEPTPRPRRPTRPEPTAERLSDRRSCRGDERPKPERHRDPRSLRGARGRRRRAGRARRRRSWRPGCATQDATVVETFEPGAGPTGAVLRDVLLHGPEPRRIRPPKRC